MEMMEILGSIGPSSVESIPAVGSATNVHFPAVYNMEDSEGNTYQYQAVWPLILPQAMTVYSHGLECTLAAWKNTAAAVTNPNNTIVIVGDLESRHIVR
jgi:hypothetical protein